MPANWRPASIPLTGGLNTGSDAKALEPGTFAQLDNAVFDGDGHPRKRHGGVGDEVYFGTPSAPPVANEWLYGYGLRDTGGTSSFTPPGQTAALRAAAVRGDELLVHDGTYLMSRDVNSARGWRTVRTGMADQQATLLREPIAHIAGLETVSSVTTPELSDISGIDQIRGQYVQVTAWQEGSSVFASAHDVATGGMIYHAAIVAPATITSFIRLGYIPPSTVGAYGTIVLVQGDVGSADLLLFLTSEADPAVWSSPSAITSTEFSAGLDVRTGHSGTYIEVAWVSTVPDARVTRVDRFGAMTHYVPTLGNAPYTFSDVGLGISPSGGKMLAWHRLNAGVYEVYSRHYNEDYSVTLSGAVRHDDGLMTSPGIITCQNLSSGALGLVFWDGVFTVGADGVHYSSSGSSNYYYDRLELAGQAFRVGETICVPCQYTPLPGPGQIRQMVVLYYDRSAPDAGNLIPVASWARGTSYASSGGVGKFSVSSMPEDGPWNVLKHYVPALQVDSGSTVALGTRTTSSLVDFGAPIRSVQAGQSTYFAGGVVMEYDGRSLHEAGFLDVPRPELVANTSGFGLLTALATYTYRIYLVHRNAQAELTRSAAFTQTVTLGVGNDSVSITLPPQPLCTRPDVKWEVYRSQGNGAFLTLAMTNDFQDRQDSRVVVDNASDASIATEPADPAPSAVVGAVGVLDNVAPPACSIIAQGRERVWYAGGELRLGQVAYSKFYDPTETPGWNEALVLETDRANPVTGLGFLGPWTVVFSDRNTYQVAGDGPSNLGLGDFEPAQLLIANSGCLSPDSVVQTPLGIAFQSRVGPRVLGHGGALLSSQSGLLGSEVDGSFSQVLASCAVPEREHAQWLMADGTRMLWDYAVNKWSRWTGAHLTPASLGTGTGLIYHPALSGAVLVESDRVVIEDTGEYTDGGIAYRFIASLGWISPHGALSWGRVRRWSLDGDALGAFTGRVYIDYDFKLSRRQLYTWAASTSYAGSDGTTYDHDPNEWGDGAWGSQPAWGGDTADGGAFPVNVRFNRQKTTAFRFTITDDTESGPTLGLRSLTIEFAPEAGLVRTGGRNI